jgi:D-alanyl-D-alanine carboxypeptidase/D-alanyl-D-alanine-endopeptidase (penicillin-binding protein 4)
MATKSRYASVYEQSLPLAGKEGSVSGFLKDTPLTGLFRLKSGSNQTTTCYAGYYQKNKTKWAVVMMVNHTNVSRNQVRTDLQDFLLTR